MNDEDNSGCRHCYSNMLMKDDFVICILLAAHGSVTLICGFVIGTRSKPRCRLNKSLPLNSCDIVCMLVILSMSLLMLPHSRFSQNLKLYFARYGVSLCQKCRLWGVSRFQYLGKTHCGHFSFIVIPKLNSSFQTVLAQLMLFSLPFARSFLETLLESCAEIENMQ